VSEPQSPPQPKRALHWTGAAIALLTIGLLILIPSGLCTAVFGIGDITGGGSFDETIPSLLMILIVGGIPAAIGAALVYAGLKARK
jgi:hypothetical protein